MEGPCEGSLTVARTIPGITMALGDTVYVDLTNPRIFERPPDNAISYSGTPLYGFEHVKVALIKNKNDNDHLSMFEITGRSIGEAQFLILAGAGCLENSTPLNITVQ